MKIDCGECSYNDTNCYIRYWNDVVEYGETEWICPVCGKSHIKKSADFICENCGFTYECS